MRIFFNLFLLDEEQNFFIDGVLLHIAKKKILIHQSLGFRFTCPHHKSKAQFISNTTVNFFPPARPLLQAEQSNTHSQLQPCCCLRTFTTYYTLWSFCVYILQYFRLQKNYSSHYFLRSFFFFSRCFNNATNYDMADYAEDIDDFASQSEDFDNFDRDGKEEVLETQDPCQQMGDAFQNPSFSTPQTNGERTIPLAASHSTFVIPSENEIADDIQAIFDSQGDFPDDSPSDVQSPSLREIPDITIIFYLARNSRPPSRQHFTRLFQVFPPSFVENLDSFHIVKNRIEISTKNFNAIPEMARILRKFGGAMTLLAAARRSKILITAEFRFFRVSLWGLPRKAEREIQAFLINNPSFPSSPLLCQITIKSPMWAPQNGVSATLFYTSAPAEFFNPKFKKEFVTPNAVIRWGIPKPPEFMERTCRFCPKSILYQHPTHLCFLHHLFPVRYPLTPKEASLAPLAPRFSPSDDVEWYQHMSDRLDIFKCFVHDPNDNLDIMAPPSVDNVIQELKQGFLGNEGIASSSSDSGGNSSNIDINMLASILNQVASPVNAGKKRKTPSNEPYTKRTPPK